METTLNLDAIWVLLCLLLNCQYTCEQSTGLCVDISNVCINRYDSGIVTFKTAVNKKSDVFTIIHKPKDSPDIKYMVVGGNSIMGGHFLDPIYADQPIFVNFAIQQAIIYDSRISFNDDRQDLHLQTGARVLQLGLGVGSTATFLRQQGVIVDVVELNEEVVKVAFREFEYNSENGTHGTTYINDAYIHIMARRNHIHSYPNRQLYSIVIHDVFLGYNPWPLLSKEFFATIKNRWLSPNGKLLLNFVGYYRTGANGLHRASHRLTAAVLRTLRSEFKSVRCYREIPLDMDADNMVTTFFTYQMGLAWWG